MFKTQPHLAAFSMATTFRLAQLEDDLSPGFLSDVQLAGDYAAPAGGEVTSAGPETAPSVDRSTHESGMGLLAAGMAEFRDWLADQFVLTGVDPERAATLAADPTILWKHAMNFHELSGSIRALGGYPPTIDDLRGEHEWYQAVMKKYERDLKAHLKSPAGKRGLPMPDQPRWALEQQRAAAEEGP